MEKKVNSVARFKNLSDNDGFAILSENETRNIWGGKTYYWAIENGKLVLKLKK
jgi:hypothetical protein